MKGNYNLSLMQRYSVRKQCEQLADKRISDLEEDIGWALDVIMLYALHHFPDTQWGATRLERFYRFCMSVHEKLRIRYGMEDDPNSAVWAAARDLKEVGIDVRAMRNRASKEVGIFTDVKQPRCPECSCILDRAADWRFCPHCGLKLDRKKQLTNN